MNNAPPLVQCLGLPQQKLGIKEVLNEQCPTLGAVFGVATTEIRDKGGS